ncbi:STAS domain-containing protein [Streptomyces cinerochromogenes]|uniref:STAS domain-containing protein n=1 Tax=Streptomyces cinerochromogenes TaxID=66422 RepID=UPI00167057B8|nr:STAS domain-containing protein [Streptomyces cinerochromogenes]GGS62196.1 hypothetical protein GCM10010206_25550 [Streptomyces cinerochromogenes]
MNTDRPASREQRHPLQVHVRRLRTDRHLVRVVGDLDLHTASHLADVLQPLVLTGGHSVLVDLSDVAFLDSAGLTCLIAVYRTARSTGARVALIAPSERVRRMLAVTGTDQVLHSYASPDAVPD